MKNNILIVLMLSISISAISQEPINWVAFSGPLVFDYEYRDTNDHFFLDTLQTNNIWQIGSPSKSIFNSAYSGNLAIVTDSLNPYPTSNQSSFIIQLYSDDHTELSFKHKYDFDEGYDGGIIEVSFDMGNTWMNIIDTLGFGDYDNNYNTSIASYNNMTGYSGSTDEWQTGLFYFRYPQYGTLFKFTMSSDPADNQREGWIIDDLQFWIIGTSVEEVKNTPIKIYPNPFNDFVQIKFENQHKFDLKLIDIDGRVILQNDNLFSSDYRLDSSNLKNGIYILEITLPDEIQRIKIVK